MHVRPCACALEVVAVAVVVVTITTTATAIFLLCLFSGFYTPGQDSEDSEEKNYSKKNQNSGIQKE